MGRRIQKSYRGQTTHWVWDGNNPLHEWVEGELEPLDEKRAQEGSYAALWRADPAIKRREAELASPLAQGPPQRGSRLCAIDDAAIAAA